MDYSTYLKVKYTAKKTGKGLFKVISKIIKFILSVIINLCRFGLYIISSLIVCVFGIGFPAGICFAFIVAKEMLNGTPFFETSKWGLFLLFFAVPLVFGVIKTITKPRT